MGWLGLWSTPVARVGVIQNKMRWEWDEVLSGKSEGKDATGKNKFPASKEK
jgi:hypothetical protein